MILGFGDPFLAQTCLTAVPHQWPRLRRQGRLLRACCPLIGWRLSTLNMWLSAGMLSNLLRRRESSQQVKFHSTMVPLLSRLHSGRLATCAATAHNTQCSCPPEAISLLTVGTWHALFFFFFLKENPSITGMRVANFPTHT